VWATAQVLESANAAASAIAVSFMVVSFVVQIRGNCIITIKPLLAAGMADDAIAFPSVSDRAAVVLLRVGRKALSSLHEELAA
jgi:hypothetical protein